MEQIKHERINSMIKEIARVQAQELEAGMSTEFGKLVKVSNYETLNRVVVTTNIMQFDLKAKQTVVVYN
jgi:hypothetical protein